tara:strand:+ start:244 stop:471 length:228 start_codon:yes stop_codon:yes gene_type:complete
VINKSEVINIIAEALDVSKELVNEDSSISDFQEWDSLGHLTILSALDEKLGEDYQETEELSSAQSVKDILNALNK